MPSKKFQTYFLVATLLAVFALSIFIMLPYMQGLVVAAAFAVVFHPFYKHVVVLMRGYESIAAFLCVIVVLVLVFAPLVFFGVQIAQEARDLYVSLVANGSAAVSPAVAWNDLNSIFPQFTQHVSLENVVKQVGGALLDHVGSLFSSTVKAFVNLFVGLVAFYYLLRDGGKFRQALVELSPLPNEYDEVIFERLEIAVNSVLKGTLVIALIQGILTGTGFRLFGVPSPALWGAVAAVAALVPGLGTSLVIAPGIIYLLIIGETSSGIGLLIWGMTAVGLIDQFLGPKLIERGINIHPMFIILSVLGGIGFFGPLGFFIGPLLLSYLFTLLHIYRMFVLSGQETI